MSQKEQWLEIVVLIICDRLPLFILEKWFKVFYYEVETVEIIFETSQIGLVGWIKRKVLSAPFTRTNNSGKVTHRRLCVISDQVSIPCCHTRLAPHNAAPASPSILSRTRDWKCADACYSARHFSHTSTHRLQSRL